MSDNLTDPNSPEFIRESIRRGNAAADILTLGATMLREAGENSIEGVGDKATIQLGYEPNGGAEYALAAEASWMVFIKGAQEGRNMATNANSAWAFDETARIMREVVGEQEQRLANLEAQAVPEPIAG